MIKAVVVGINTYKYFSDQNLAGCVNDVDDVIGYLTDLGAASSDLTALYDYDATKEAITRAVQDMIAGSRPGDHLLFHFSGHGTQVAASDINEPDALDEVLCPTDFDFSDSSSSLSDNEIATLVSRIPANVAWTLVVDACHSGDLMKDLAKVSAAAKPRFLRPPPEVAQRLARRRRVIRKRALGAGTGVSVSACTSAETAADTSFDGRPNGAFTYHWLRTVKGSTSSLDELVKTVGAPLAAFRMHPEVQGSYTMRTAPFLSPAARATSLVTRATTRSAVLFETQWSSSVMGLPISLGLRVLQASSGFIFELTPGVAGAKLTIPAPVDGNASIPIPLSIIGQVVVDVGGWNLSSTQLDCDIAARVVPSLPFIPQTTIARQHLSMPVRSDDRGLTLPQSAAELHAMIELLRGATTPKLRQTDQPSRGRAITAADNTPFATRQDRFGWGPNWREDRAIMVGPLPHNQIRHGEPIFFNQQGAGQVSFMGWLNDDPADASFVVHIGNHFFGGWGSIGWQVMAVYGDINIVLRDMQPREAPVALPPQSKPSPTSPSAPTPRDLAPEEHRSGNGVPAKTPEATL